jgi:hypothetical protein
MTKEKTKMQLFLELANPNENGISDWIPVSTFVDQYKELQLGNGGSWLRKSSSLAKKYVVERDISRTQGNSIDAIRLNGFNTEKSFNQNIRKDIRDFYRCENCVMLGVNGTSENTKIEIDHKDGRKNDETVSNLETQELKHFQPLCKAANDAKRQICKQCKNTDKRWDAKNIKGNPYSYYEGDERYNADLGCVGCYQYDPVEYRKVCIKKISKEAAEYITNKFFPEDT